MVSASTVNLQATPSIFASAMASSLAWSCTVVAGAATATLIVVVQSEGQINIVVHGLDARRQEHAVRRDGGLVGRTLDLRLAAAAQQGEGARGIEIDFHCALIMIRSLAEVACKVV